VIGIASLLVNGFFIVKTIKETTVNYSHNYLHNTK
jgi:hypothetical protein